MELKGKEGMNRNKSDKQNVNCCASQRKRSIFDIEVCEEVGSLELSEDSDSDSSDNCQEPPKLLTDLNLNENEDRKVEEKNKDITADVAKDLENTNLDQNEFYDFSKIIKSLKEVTGLSKKLSRKPQRPRRRGRSEVNSDDSAIDSLDVKDLLQIGENKRCSIENKDTDDIEEEENAEAENEENEYDVKFNEPIQVTIQEPNLFNRERKVGNRFETELKRLLALKRKRDQIILHKAHLVCLIASGSFMNSIANNQDLLAIALSIIPSKKYYPPAKTSRAYVLSLLRWFYEKMKLKANEQSGVDKSLLEDLIEDFASCAPRSRNNMVLIFILLGRVLGLKCRLVINLCPVPLKPPSVDIFFDSEQQKKHEDKEITSPSSNEFGTLKKKNAADSKTKRKSIEEQNKSRATSKNSAVRQSKNKKDAKSNSVNTIQPVAVKRKVLSSSEDEDNSLTKYVPKKKAKKVINIWSEIYIETEEKWICVNVVENAIDTIQQIHDTCTSPVSYILAWNTDGRIKDVTRRYVPQWHLCLKTRVESKWWNSTLDPWKPRPDSINEKEDEQLEKKAEEMPFPNSIKEFKNHPLYALRRDLLKFEAIYPPTAVPLGKIKGEDIYARACVVELHTKESWKKEGKVLRPNQEPYKIVKARPKREKGTNKLIKDLPLNLYGHWQVEDYIPPVAVDGKVPRNEFGNVEVYKPTMLPKGTVHLQLPGLMRIAKKLDIDCAHAVVGWEFRGQGSHPVLDGVVVCEEFKTQLIDAWNKEIDESQQRQKESQTKRALLNWRKMVKAILLRKKLKSKYGFEFKKLLNNPNRCRHKKKEQLQI